MPETYQVRGMNPSGGCAERKSSSGNLALCGGIDGSPHEEMMRQSAYGPPTRNERHSILVIPGRDWDKSVPVMNVHHLELFYYVVKHGGISEAVRRMPYGIQQPAVSGQILQLEAHLGLKLFQRRPFVLTPAGRELFEFVEPFFGRLIDTGERLRGAASRRLRLAASATILRDHFPVMLEQFRKTCPDLTLQLHDTNQAMAESLLQKQEIDLAITELEDKTLPGIKSAALIKLPLVLLVRAARNGREPALPWKDGDPSEPLISLPPNEVISKLFRRGLERLGVNWRPSVEVSSLELVTAYVNSGFGIGVSLAPPGWKPPSKVRMIILSDFPAVVVSAFWQAKLPPIAEAFLKEVRLQAEMMQRP